MNLLLLLDMAASARGDATAVQAADRTLSAGELLTGAWAGADLVAGRDAVAYVGTNGLGFPVALFSAAAAGVPFVPLNYRLAVDQLDSMLQPLGDVVVVGEGSAYDALAERGHPVIAAGELVAAATADDASGHVPVDADGPAVLLYTSGTTSAPADGAGLPTLRTLSYGGARTPTTVLRRVMDLLPDVDLTNAYGLTETSSTIAVLGPDDHRAARGGDPVAVSRLASAGRVLPTVEVEVRDVMGQPVPAGEPGEIFVRGEQVSGEYATGAVVDGEGWFPTRDRGWLDEDGYLFIEGRSDDTIIRGGENVAPAEIEEVLLRHPGIAECAVVGVPDDEWGQRIAVAVVAHPGADLDVEAVRAFARQSLRSSKTPDVVSFVDALPYTETGKLLRRVVQADLQKRA